GGRAPRAAARALYAVGALGESGDLTLVDSIFLASDGAVAYAAEAALVTLGALAAAHALGDAEPRALRFLSLAATSSDAATRRAATAALARLGGSIAIEALMLALADEE